MSELIVTAEDWPYGLRCMDCNEKLPEDSAYSKRLVAVADLESPVVEIVCVPCGLGLVAESEKR